MRARDLLLAGLAVTATLSLAACGGTATSAAPTTVTVPSTVDAATLAGVTLNVGDQKGGGAQALLTAAGLANAPYKIKWDDFTSGPPMLEAANAGAIDIGQVGNTPPIFSAAANANIEVVAALRDSEGDGILVPKNSTITTLADLRGKTIAVPQGSSANGTLLNALNKAGLKPSDVKLAFLQPADAYSAFARGSVDAWAIWDPYLTEAVTNLGAKPLVSGTDAFSGSGLAGGTPLSNGYSFDVASRASLSNAGKNTAIADYLNRLGRAEIWASQHIDQWAAIYAQETNIPVSVARAALPKLIGHLTPLNNDVIASEQNLANAFTASGQIPAKIDFSKFVDTRYNADLASVFASGK
ncbi:MAG TPA: ABC transporter substrate-binding protein [Pseudonocardiaceae bacterium]